MRIRVKKSRRYEMKLGTERGFICTPATFLEKFNTRQHKTEIVCLWGARFGGVPQHPKQVVVTLVYARVLKCTSELPQQDMV